MVQLTVRVSEKVVARAEELIPALSAEQGRDVTRIDVVRRALSLGLRELRKKAGSMIAAAEDDDD